MVSSLSSLMSVFVGGLNSLAGQVVYKRKPVCIKPIKQDPDDDAMVSESQPSLVMDLQYSCPCLQVWQINETGEVFNTYDDYLDR